jgi:small subunit ribosomal protein S4
MARYTDASCRLCRREGEKLFLKGQRCYTGKCALARRSFAPGQHGQGRKKTSEYGTQIREKQKAKRFYGVMETQFRNTYDKASRMKGKPGENLLMLLEMRFDNIIYRMGLAASRAEARQLVTHGHFTVNGKKADIPSMQLAVGDVVEVRETSRKSAKFRNLMAVMYRHGSHLTMRLSRALLLRFLVVMMWIWKLKKPLLSSSTLSNKHFVYAVA